MNKRPGIIVLIFRLVIVLAGWFGLLLQLYLIINSALLHKVGLLSEIIRFFSYFTILTNLLVAVCITGLIIKPASGFFSRPAIQSGIAVYIAIVGIVYSLFLREIWDPQGWQLIADRILHDIIPVLYFLYWLFFVPKGKLPWKLVINWLLYPALYLLYILIRGAFTRQYPYPFIDVNELGYTGMLLNAVMMLAGFVVVGLLIVIIDRIVKASADSKFAG